MEKSRVYVLKCGDESLIVDFDGENGVCAVFKDKWEAIAVGRRLEMALGKKVVVCVGELKVGKRVAS